MDKLKEWYRHSSPERQNLYRADGGWENWASCAWGWFWGAHILPPALPLHLVFLYTDISSTSPAHGPRLHLAPCMSDIFEKQGKCRKPILGMLDHVFEDRLRNHGAGWTTTSACGPEPERHMPHWRSPSEVKEERRKNLHYYHPSSRAF